MFLSLCRIVLIKKKLTAPVLRKHADIVRDAIFQLLLPEKVHMVTFDHGKESAFHSDIKETLDSENYFAYPYHSWGRGLDKNHNGLSRQYLPKGMALDKVGVEKVAAIQERLNNYPKKMLGYKTPNEFYKAIRLAA